MTETTSAPTTAAPEATGPKPAHPALEFLRAFARNQSAIIGLILLAIVLGTTFLGPVFYDVDPYSMVDMPFVAPGGDYAPLGTDYLGRDMLAGIIEGGRATLTVGAAAAVISVVIGILIGSLAGYFGGWIDAALTKVTEFFQILPTLLLAMVLVTIFGATLVTITVAIGAVSWPQVARLARAEFMKIRKLDYVQCRAHRRRAKNGYLIFARDPTRRPAAADRGRRAGRGRRDPLRGGASPSSASAIPTS